jgi:Uncharacterized protein conserved in bacteria (DUF2130)
VCDWRIRSGFQLHTIELRSGRDAMLNNGAYSLVRSLLASGKPRSLMSAEQDAAARLGGSDPSTAYALTPLAGTRSSAGKGEKMEAMYDYLTSPQFAHKLKAVYETFKKMREELESEKNVTTQRWARREKQLQAGVTQLLGIGGEIQGLAQQELPMLEMENPAED